MFFHILISLFVLVLFRKTKHTFTQTTKLETLFCLSWFLFYFVLAMISIQFELQLVNEISNWLLFVLFPLLVTARLRKETFRETLHEIGLKRFDKITGLKTLLVCLIYIGIIFTVFCMGDEVVISTVILDFNDSHSRFYRRIFLSGDSPEMLDEYVEATLYGHPDYQYFIWTLSFSICILQMTE